MDHAGVSKSETSTIIESGSSTMSDNEKTDPLMSEEPLEPADGGYGWIVVLAQFLINATGWGVGITFGVFLSYYRTVQYFPGATDLQFAFIGGVMLSSAIFVAPLANYIASRFHFKTPMYIGVVFTTIAQLLAAFSTKIWQLFLTQGLLYGVGFGLIYIPTIPIVSTWFNKKRALAIGLTAAGAGAGSLVLAFTTHAAIENLSLKWAFIINAIITATILLPTVTVMKSRGPVKFATLKYQFWYHLGFIWVLLWGFFSMLGYIIAVFSIATYSTAGLGQSQSQGATLAALLALGQMLGRPVMGLLLDRFGRISFSIVLSIITGLACLLIWMFARSFGVLVVFALIQGFTSGIMWVSAGPITAEIVGISNLASAMSILWITLAPAALIAEPIALSLIDYSQNTLHRSGADAYLICIGFAGSCFIFSAILLLGAKRYKQGNWNVLERS